MTNTVKKFASYFERQDTIQNAVFVIKNAVFSDKKSICNDKNCILNGILLLKVSF